MNTASLRVYVPPSEEKLEVVAARTQTAVKGIQTFRIGDDFRVQFNEQMRELILSGIPDGRVSAVKDELRKMGFERFFEGIADK